MSDLDALFATDPFDRAPESRQLFVRSFKECARHHYAGNPVFRAFWQDAAITPDDIGSEQDLLRVPPLMVHLFKERRLTSVPDEQIALALTSSGTGGQKSQMLLDAPSLARVKRLAFNIHKALGMTSAERYNYLCFTYDPSVAVDLGTAFTDELLTSFTGKSEVYYAIQWDARKGDFVLNVEGTIAALKRFANSTQPVRILGFPAHLHRILRDHDLRLSLGPGSWVQTGGGWKGLAEQELPKAQFRSFVSERLGIPPSNIRDMFGMVEHGIPYVDCPRGRLHVSNYSRVFIRSPKDLSVMPEGQAGLIHFLASYNTSYPSISLLSTDWGRLDRCDCEIGGNTLEILGRAGVTKHKGCAVTANQLLEG